MAMESEVDPRLLGTEADISHLLESSESGNKRLSRTVLDGLESGGSNVFRFRDGMRILPSFRHSITRVKSALGSETMITW